MRSPRVAVDVGVLVADMERSLTFYHDLLGLAVVAEIPTSLIGRGQMVQLKHGESLIKLVQLNEIPSVQNSTDIASVLGYRYITLLVRELDEIAKKLGESEICIVMPLTQLSNGARILMVQDPDDNVVEFVQEV